MERDGKVSEEVLAQRRRIASLLDIIAAFLVALRRLIASFAPRVSAARKKSGGGSVEAVLSSFAVRAGELSMEALEKAKGLISDPVEASLFAGEAERYDITGKVREALAPMIGDLAAFSEAGGEDSDIAAFMADPSAFAGKGGFVLPGIGRGRAHSPLRAMEAVLLAAVIGSYTRSRIRSFGLTGAIGYMAYRGSTYDCPACDASCGRLLPLWDMRFPMHARCCCVVVPVYAGGIAF